MTRISSIETLVKKDTYYLLYKSSIPVKVSDFSELIKLARKTN